QACCCVPVRNVPSTSSLLFAWRASLTQLRAFLARLANTEVGPRTFCFHGAGPPAASETLPAFLRLARSNTTGASSFRAASSPLTAGRRSLVSPLPAHPPQAVLR